MATAANRSKYKKTKKGKAANSKYARSSKGREACLRFRHGSEAVELFNSFFEKQKGCCAGCGKHQSELKTHLALDHDHETGEYRGLLCFRCNSAAGSSEKDLQILKNLVKYLEDFYE